MKNKVVKRMLTVGLSAVLAVSVLAGCGGGKDSGGKNNEFRWWIAMTDSNGEYYETYDQNSVVQYVNQQYWDVENGGIGDKESGKQLSLSFLTPVSGEEQDNFNTMIATGEYPEIMDLSYSTDSPQVLHDNGVLMDITEYVEKYMPNYLAYLEENPELKPLVTSKDEEGNIHYYAVYTLGDGVSTPWNGQCYRRDLVVKYAVPTEYVWDWESDYVKENGHPAVTPLAKAQKENNLEGWKKNEVTAFTADYGENPEEDYTDNVIFPSGTSVPLTISDWEWMFEAFDKAFEARGWAEDTGAYCTSIGYGGDNNLGNLVSSFGGGTGGFYLKDGQVSYDGYSENYKAYLECMSSWYEKGWLDSQFYTRAGDMFFQIDSADVKQGKVGTWSGMSSELGTAIRPTCINEEDKADAFVMGSAMPINDVYGGEEQMYQEPDALYQDSRVGAKVGITTKAEKKDLDALFTYFDWTYTLEGAATLRLGLNEEQYQSVKLEPDMFKEYDFTTAYTVEKQEDGPDIYVPTFNSSNPMQASVMGHRMTIGMALSGNGELCWKDNREDAVYKNAYEEWTRYVDTGSVGNYIGLLNSEDSTAYNKIQTAAIEYKQMNAPKVITGELRWEDYKAGFEALNPSEGCQYLQKYVSGE